jgi:hypothetical protein
MFLRNVDKFLLAYTASYLRRYKYLCTTVPSLWLSLVSGMAQYKYLSALQVNQLIERVRLGLNRNFRFLPGTHGTSGLLPLCRRVSPTHATTAVRPSSFTL